MYNKGGLVESKTNYVKNSAGVKTLASKFTYTFNCNGSVRSESSEIPGQSGILKEYVYDGAGRLSAETQTSTADNTVLYSGSFTYDRNGNRLTSTNTADGQSVTTAYTYDKNNRLISTQTGSDVTLYTYDANGNTLTAGNKSYTYDEYNRQKRYEVDGSSKGVYEYSANGLRSVKNGRGLIWLGDKMVYEFGIGNGVRGTVYTYGFGIATADGETSYLKNAHGDVVQLVRNGAVVKNYRYNAFGEEIGIDENDENPFRYCGEYYDAESGTIYLRARYYNPANGRFTTLDPAMDGLNRYAYCGNEPVNRIDSWGLFDYFSILSLDVYNFDDVVALQVKLQELGYLTLSPLEGMGVYGYDTQFAVNQYKNKKKIYNEGAHQGVVDLDVWTSLGLIYRTQDDINAGVEIRTNTNNGIQVYDVTMPFNNLLKWVAAFGEENKYNAFEFYALVNHGALLDIKREKSWIAAMSITYPGSISSEVLYNGEIFTPEQLGNYLYGYAGTAFRFGESTLLGGSIFASGIWRSSTNGERVLAELNDHYYIRLGINKYGKQRT